ncbi:hypothetical protein ASPBRDRAFT_415730 [Aspergillus brasiliensis CBS 101740]|uniref:Uncharacterized protein n=1 Tax=Aspergillus brasiliensis (strain CBS 101740 / IMI 381727 / IBT 21946) TaxID=767769 RepID=A0A1L9UY58_ASPBC|nr:hypothetical protein ASPBRDRAFT_415730 [Aspergillus brasiliensis CBS 101740]
MLISDRSSTPEGAIQVPGPGTRLLGREFVLACPSLSAEWTLIVGNPCAMGVRPYVAGRKHNATSPSCCELCFRSCIICCSVTDQFHRTRARCHPLSSDHRTDGQELWCNLRPNQASSVP